MSFARPTLLLLCYALALAACQESVLTTTPAAYFPALPTTDTLHIYPDRADADSGQLIPLETLYTFVDSAFVRYILESSYSPTEPTFRGHGQFALDQQTTAYILGVYENWFVFKYLLLYHQETQQFESIEKVAEFYGGEGGQIWQESHLFDFEELPQLLSRMDEHTLRIREDGSTLDQYDPTVSGYVWTGEEFQEITLENAEEWIQKYPVKW